MRNNSTRLKGKKKLQIKNIRVSSATGGRYVTNKGWKALKGKKAVHTSCKHGIRRVCNLIPKVSKDDRPANSRDMNTLETIWIIVDETTYKDSAPKTLDELRQRLHFALKNVHIDKLWELVHSIPHHLENVRKHQGRYSSANISLSQC